MTEQELIERGNIYKSLIEHPGWILLCQEGKEMVDCNIAQIMGNNTEAMFVERGMVKGIAKVLVIPTDAISEATRIINAKTDQADASR